MYSRRDKKLVIGCARGLLEDSEEEIVDFFEEILDDLRQEIQKKHKEAAKRSGEEIRIGDYVLAACAVDGVAGEGWWIGFVTEKEKKGEQVFFRIDDIKALYRRATVITFEEAELFAKNKDLISNRDSVFDILSRIRGSQ